MEAEVSLTDTNTIKMTQIYNKAFYLQKMGVNERISERIQKIPVTEIV